MWTFVHVCIENLGLNGHQNDAQLHTDKSAFGPEMHDRLANGTIDTFTLLWESGRGNPISPHFSFVLFILPPPSSSAFTLKVEEVEGGEGG